MKNIKRQGGWLVTEALVTIVISAIFAAGAVQLFATYERSLYKESVSAGLLDLKRSIGKGFTTRNDYTGVSESSVREMGLLPGVFLASGPDGADLSVAPGPSGTFDIGLEFGSEASANGWCADLLPDGERQWVATGAGASVGDGLQPGMTMGDAMTACEGATVFTFRGM